MSEAVKEVAKKERPQFTNINVADLAHYRLPLAGVVSILHRVSGAALFLALPYLLSLFHKSLLSEDTFLHFRGIVSIPLVKLVLLGLIWAYMQHFCAGLRHLFMDAHIGIDKESARRSAAAVLAASLALTALCGLKLFGVF